MSRKFTTMVFIFLSLVFLFPHSFACELTSEKINIIQTNELRYLQERIPPAFKHAVEDNSFKLSTSITADCHVRMQATLEASALTEANQSLDENPAKRIMLSSQGYALPDSETVQFDFDVNDNLAPRHADTLQTSALGKARASIEMVYSILTQNRASKITDTQQNNIAWSNAYTDKFLKACIQSQKNYQLSTSTCECKAKAFAGHLNQREMEYSEYIRSNPYAKATGADKGYSSIEQKILLSCKE